MKTIDLSQQIVLYNHCPCKEGKEQDAQQGILPQKGRDDESDIDQSGKGSDEEIFLIKSHI